MSKRFFYFIDVCIFCGFTVFALLYFAGRYQGVQPYIFLGSDAGNIASFAAALEYPEYFASDALLQDPGNFRHYATFHVPLWGYLEKLLGDFGLAALSLLVPHIVLHGFGYYLLGREILRSRIWALIFSLATFFLHPLPLATFWGLYKDPIPRVGFQALLPYLLLLAFRWRMQPGKWPLVFILIGIGMYVHPVSAPAWALALWCSMFVCQPSEWSILKRTQVMVSLGVLYLIVSAPFLYIYLNNHAHGLSDQYDLVFKAMSARMAPGFMDVQYAVSAFCTKLFNEYPSIWLSPVLFTLFFLFDKSQRRDLVFFLFWVLGIAAAAIGIPFIEHSLAKANNSIPTQVDLIRNQRYFLPLSVLLCCWSLSGLSERLELCCSRQSLRRLIRTSFVCLSCAVFWANINLPPRYVHPAALAWQNGSFYPPRSRVVSKMMEYLNWLKTQTAADASFLPIGKSIPVLSYRYAARRSLSFAHKDGGAFAYANHAALLEWFKVKQKIDDASEIKEISLKTLAYLEIAKELRTDYLVLDYELPESFLTELEANRVYHNQLGKRAYVTVLSLAAGSGPARSR